MKVSSCWAESLGPLQKAFLLPKHSWSLLPPWTVKRRPCVPGLIFIITTLLLLGFISSFWWLLAYNWVCFSIPCDLGYVIAIDFSLPGPSFVLTLSWSVSRTAVNGCPISSRLLPLLTDQDISLLLKARREDRFSRLVDHDLLSNPSLFMGQCN